jgi:selenocysteine lyase/cysteine desulfurase
LFPLLVAERHAVTVEQVPFEGLVDRIVPGTSLVACSLVQMQTARVAALGAILDRAAEVGARVLVDATHGLPFVGAADGAVARADYVVCAGYKHLLCPRGVSLFVVRGDRQDDLTPWNANWRTTEGHYQRYFGGPLTLVATAGRFDVSPAWFPWIGGVESLELLCTWAADGSIERARLLAGDIAGGLDVPWGGSSVVSVPVGDLDATAAALGSARVKAGVRGGRVRLSTHVYNTPEDVELVSRVLRPFVAR